MFYLKLTVFLTCAWDNILLVNERLLSFESFQIITIQCYGWTPRVCGSFLPTKWMVFLMNFVDTCIIVV